MIIVRILGGLGNQMFQYAYAKMLQEKGYKVALDVSGFKNYKLHGGYQLHHFKINIPQATALQLLLAKVFFWNYKKEKNLLFNSDFLQPKKNAYLKGYFQTEKYFKEIRTTLLQQFNLPTTFSEKALAYKNEIEQCKTSCSIHIRRGDYVNDKKNQQIHGSCSLAYYERAITLISDKFPKVHFFIFSDDIAWVKENLPVEKSTFIELKSLPHEDMLLMSCCQHNITANSSFSWWGAWLNTNTNKTVIAPKKWFVTKENEVACKSWTLL